MALFERTLHPLGSTKILDVGGSPGIWQCCSVQPRLTFLNLPAALVSSMCLGNQVGGDGRMLPFADKSFDIVFSNSVIEHVGTQQDQTRFAEEVARVGVSYWVQTPNRFFPVELHAMLPLIHFLPRPLRRELLYRFTPWQLIVCPTREERSWYLEHILNELNLLDSPSLKKLFPDAQIVRETFLGFVKSIVAVR